MLAVAADSCRMGTHMIDAPSHLRQLEVMGRPLGPAGDQDSPWGQNRRQPTPDRFRRLRLEVDGRIAPKDDIPRPIFHAGQQIGDLPVNVPAQRLGGLEIVYAVHRW